MMLKMNGLMKFGLVICGYILACLAALGAVYVNGLFIQDPSQASAGISAFGDSILLIGVFGVLAVIPTGLAIYFLFRKFLIRS
jgi:hypothetical protein